MAMAVDGSHVHSGITAATTQASQTGWSSTAWEQQNGLAESLSMEGSGGGDYAGSGRMEWELKQNAWEWENLTMVYPRQGDEQGRLQRSGWESGGCSTVTLATSAGAGSATGDFSIGLASGASTPSATSTPSGTSVSSGIPGVSAGRSSGGGEPAPSVKNEPDEQTVIGTPASLSRQKDRLFFNLGGGQSQGSEEKSPERDESGRPSGGQSNGSSVVSGGGDSLNIGLKLGRRTYFKDCAAGGQGKGPSCPAAPSAPAKKQRVMSPSTQVARCQVEGCKADLSGCKDYHKRHKVCEMHSKAPKAIAAGIEQRFCQQCSRFHVLSEFDEGKRSCRRRLAGHNERRRKPHPETHSVFGLRNSSGLYGDASRLGFESAPFYFLDSKRPGFLHRDRGASLDDEYRAYSDLKRTNPWSTTRRDDNNLAYQLQAASTERQSIFSTMSRPTADRLLMLLQNPKAQMLAPSSSAGMNPGGHHFPEGPMGPLGQGLSLSSSTGGVVGSLEQSRLSSCSQSLSSVSGMMDSGRALSLLSSQSWASRPPSGAPAPVSVGLSNTAADSTLEQLVASSSTGDSSSRGSRFAHHQQLQLPSGGPTRTSAQQQFEAQFSVQSGVLDAVALNCGLTATGNGTHGRQGCGNGSMVGGLGGYEESNSMLGLVGGGQDLDQALSNSGFGGSHEGRMTMDLMRMPSVGTHHGPQGAQSSGVHSGVSLSGGQYSGFDSLRPFESSIFTGQ